MKRFNDEVFEEVKKRIESALYDYQKMEDELFSGFVRLGESETYDRFFYNTDCIFLKAYDELEQKSPGPVRFSDNPGIKRAYFKWAEKRLAELDPLLPMICEDFDYDFRHILPFMAKQFLKDNYLSPFKITYFLLILKLVCHHTIIYGCGDKTYLNEDYKDIWER